MLFCTSLLVSMAGMEIFGWSLVLMAVVGLFLFPQDSHYLRKPEYLWLAALLAWVGLGLFLNRQFIDSPWTGFGEMRWVLPFVGVTLALFHDFEEKTADRLLIFFSVIATLISIYSISQYWIGQDWLRGPSSPLLIVEETRNTGALRYRPYGLFKMTLTYACAYAMFSVYPFCFSFKALPHDRKRFWFLQVCSWLILVSVFLTFSRGVWLSVIPVLAAILWFLNRRLLIWAAGTCALILIAAVAISPALQARMASFTNMKHQSNADRMIVWKANLRMFEDHPIFGVGYQKNGPPRVLDYYEQMGISRDAFASHAHNVYLNFLSGTGIGGLFLYLGFTLSIAWIGLQNIRKLNAGRSWLFFFAVAALSAQAIFMLGGFTEYNFGDSEVRYQFLTHLSFQLFIRRKIS